MTVHRFAALSLALTMVGAALTAGLGGPATAASTGESAPQAGRLVAEEPSATTPAIMDGTVRSLAKVGGTIVVGGTFTTVRDPGSDVDIPRTNVFAFDADTGVVEPGFAPDPDGAVYKVLPATDGRSVYLGGDFTHLTFDGTVAEASRLTKVKVSSGAKVEAFDPGSWDGSIRDLEVTGSRLWVAGKFTRVHGKKQVALATISAKTGAYRSTFTKKLAGLHRTGYAYDVTDVLSITTNPKNDRLVAAGNFTSVDGKRRAQIAMFKISSSSSKLASWRTDLFESRCAKQFDTNMTDTAFSPDGSYFAVSTNGSYGGSRSLTGESGCDVVARFETSGSGKGVRPTWTAYTGGDTTWSIEVTADAIYAGGHQRWQNNPTADNAAGQGAVERTGIAALDPVNGLPYAWNPTRLPRGVGVKDMLATDQGLFVGSDTTTFAGRTRPRLAFAPLTGGAATPSYRSVKLPAPVVTTAKATGTASREFDGRKVTAGPTTSAAFARALRDSVGAFMIRDVLYVAHADGRFSKQTVSADGSPGPATPVDTADQIVEQADWHGTDVPALTSLFYDKGRIYFTRAGKNVLYSRGFEASDDVVGQLRQSSPAVKGITYSDVRGAFLADGRLYFAKSSGKLYSARWKNGAPVAGTATRATRAGSGWASTVMFVQQG